MIFKFLLKRFSTGFGISFALLVTVYLLRGQDTRGALTDALMWALISTSIYVGAAYYHISNKLPCAICRVDGK